MEFNLAQVHEAVAAAIPDRECIVWRDRRLTYARSPTAPAGSPTHLRDRGLGVRTASAAELGGHESGQDHLGLYLHNGNEYLEAMLGAYKARVAPFNVNYRYVAEELRYLLNDAGADGDRLPRGVRADARRACCADLPDARACCSRSPTAPATSCCPGAVDYEDALAAAVAERARRRRRRPTTSTSSTPAAPPACPRACCGARPTSSSARMGGRQPRHRRRVRRPRRDRRGRRATAAPGCMPAPPFMHGAAPLDRVQRAAPAATRVVHPGRHRPASTRPTCWRPSSASRCSILLIVGDAFGRPLLDELERGTTTTCRRCSSCINGGAAAEPDAQGAVPRARCRSVMHHRRRRLVGDRRPDAARCRRRAPSATTGTFTAGAGHRASSSEDLTPRARARRRRDRLAGPAGRVPLGYLGDADKTRAHVPGRSTACATRCPATGPASRADGRIELLGRDSVTINSGGEKIFAEEVEQALAAPPGRVRRRRGRPPERALGQRGRRHRAARATGATPTDDDLLAEAARAHRPLQAARRRSCFVDQVVRSPAGKADYRWAKDVASPERGSRRTSVWFLS